MKSCDHNIKLTLQLAQEMIRLADQGDADREDTGCGILYGVLRDSAYKIRRLAEDEKMRHQAKGWWQEQCPIPVRFQPRPGEPTVKNTTNEKKEE